MYKRLVIEDIDGESTTQREVREEMLEKLLSDWNGIDSELTDRRILSDDDDYFDPMEDFIDRHVDKAVDVLWQKGERSKEILNETAYAAREEAQALWAEEQKKPFIKMNLIEQQIHALHARFARPYEHWNEEEKLIEYLETRYDNRE